MPTLTQSQSIILGKVLEKSFAAVLDAAKYSYSFSKSYHAMLTRPDYLINIDGMPVAVIAITCTQDNQTMNKKRWRYIDEIFQLKSYFGENILIVNCEFGDHSAYMKSEMNLANSFFDASILVFDLVGGPEVLELAIRTHEGHISALLHGQLVRLFSYNQNPLHAEQARQWLCHQNLPLHIDEHKLWQIFHPSIVEMRRALNLTKSNVPSHLCGIITATG